MSAVLNCLFNIFVATIHIWRPYPPSATCCEIFTKPKMLYININFLNTVIIKIIYFTGNSKAERESLEVKCHVSSLNTLYSLTGDNLWHIICWTPCPLSFVHKLIQLSVCDGPYPYEPCSLSSSIFLCSVRLNDHIHHECLNLGYKTEDRIT
jgi:hypothetical protein